jgi:hypothetical protein
MSTSREAPQVHDPLGHEPVRLECLGELSVIRVFIWIEAERVGIDAFEFAAGRNKHDLLAAVG